MKSQSEIKVTVDPDKVRDAKYPTTLLYQALIDDESAPVKWKGGEPPKDRDATEKDLVLKARVRITGNTIEAIW